MRVLVTGASGYIGNAVAIELAANGHTVYGLVRSDKFAQQLQQNEVIPVIGDMSDSKTWMETVDKVFAVIDTTLLPDPVDKAKCNRELMNYVAASGKKQGIKKRYLWTSGVMTSGNHDFVVDEETPSNTVLGQWKVAFEREVMTNPDVIGTITRPGWVYGGTFGHYINHFFVGNQDGDIELSVDASRMWSWIHIKDLARAYLAIVNASDHAINGQLFHITDDTRATYEEVRVAYARAAGVKGKVVKIPLKQEEAYFDNTALCSSQKIRRQLGWRPQHSSMMDDIPLYVATYFAHHGKNA